MLDAKSMAPRDAYKTLFSRLQSLSASELNEFQTAANASFLNQGITFTVYGKEGGTERIFPYDLLPRIITANEWKTISRGLEQRVLALNAFLRTSTARHAFFPTGLFRANWFTPANITAANCAP
jgi:uncharacterized circularly permuted ATP-grasp superfamily protein